MISTLITGDGIVYRIREPVGYVDATLVGHGAWRQFELDVLATSRHAWKGTLASLPTAGVSGTWWVTPNVALAGAIGRQLSDPMRGTVRTRYATIALRVSAERHGPVRARTVPPPVSSGRASIVAIDGEGESVVLRVDAPGARRVELMSDFTDWSPMAFERRGDRWELRLTTTPGLHHIKVRIDNGAWLAPANLPTVDDELGGVVGLLVIP